MHIGAAVILEGQACVSPYGGRYGIKLTKLSKSKRLSWQQYLFHTPDIVSLNSAEGPRDELKNSHGVFCMCLQSPTCRQDCFFGIPYIHHSSALHA